MQTSNKTLLLETGVAAAVILALSSAIWPDTVGMSTAAVHPAWIAIIALAARYGVAGLFFALPAVWLPLAGIATLDSGSTAVVAERLMTRVDLSPLIISVIVAWVTISHKDRHTRIVELLSEAEHEVEAVGRWGSALEDSLTYLRGRCDRIDASISFWRRVSERIERGDVKSAAAAALELAMVRTGARAGYVELRAGTSELLATSNFTGRDLDRDAVVTRAVTSGELQLAQDVPGVASDDCDMAIPIYDPAEGLIVGVIALHEIEPTVVKAAELSDLGLISEWLAPALTTQIRGPRLRSVTEVAR